MKKAIVLLALIGGILVLVPTATVISANYDSHHSHDRYYESEQKEHRNNRKTHMQEKNDNSNHNRHSLGRKETRNHCH